VGDRPEAKGGRSRQQATREGAPPVGGQCSALLSRSRLPRMNLSAMCDNAIEILPRHLVYGA
jgi:hypothetical protein